MSRTCMTETSHVGIIFLKVHEEHPAKITMNSATVFQCLNTLYNIEISKLNIYKKSHKRQSFFYYFNKITFTICT